MRKLAISRIVVENLDGLGMQFPEPGLVAAIFIAVGSNNFLKAIYAVTLGEWQVCLHAMAILHGLGGLTLGYGLVAF